MSGEEQAAGKGSEEQQATGGSKPGDDGAKSTPPSVEPAAETLKLGAEEMIKRRSMWQSSMAALRYVSSVSQDNEVKLRDSDRATSLALLIVCVFALLTLVLPQLISADQPEAIRKFLQWMASQRTPLVLAADALVGVGLLRYAANRFGIMTTLTPRQALLCWHLMLGSSLLGIFMSINLALLCFVAVANSHITIPEAHPELTQPPATGPGR